MDADMSARAAEAAPAQSVGRAQRFTESEKELLAKFRQQLPEIVQSAEEVADEPVSATLWGVPLLPGTGSAEQHDLRVDVVLLKFLKARRNSLDQASEMLRNTLVWRAEFHVDEVLGEEFPKDVFGAVGYIYGRDREGRPVTYNFYGGLDNKTVFGDLDRFLRWRVQLHERGMRMLDFVDTADMVQVHDYERVGLFSYDKFARAASKATVQLMSDNYPETLATKVFANVPAWGETIFNAINRWLSDDTRKKFVVVGAANAGAVLGERIGAENLPAKFSGKSEQPAAKSGEEGADVPPTATTAADDAPTKTEKAHGSDSPPDPQPAHMNAAESLPAPTAGGDANQIEEGAKDKVAEPAPAPAQVTEAPEEAPEHNGGAITAVAAAAAEDDEPTAGMRIDDKTAAAESDAMEVEEKIEEQAAAVTAPEAATVPEAATMSEPAAKVPEPTSSTNNNAQHHT